MVCCMRNLQGMSCDLLHAILTVHELWFAACHLVQVLVGLGGGIVKIFDDALDHLGPEGVLQVQHVLPPDLTPGVPPVNPFFPFIQTSLTSPLKEAWGIGGPVLKIESLNLEVSPLHNLLVVDVAGCGSFSVVLMPVDSWSMEHGGNGHRVVHKILLRVRANSFKKLL